MDKVKFSVLSSCISRDVLDFNAQINSFGSDKYMVERHVSRISSYTMLTGCAFDINQATFDSLKNIPNFNKRCVCLDLNKSSLEYIGDVHSDWLIYDFGNEHLSVYKSKSGDILFTSTWASNVGLEIIKSITKCDDFDLYESYILPEDEYIQRINAIFDSISSLYKPNEIILTCVQAADYYIELNGAMQPFSKATIEKYKRLNKMFAKFELLFMERFKGCHIIPALPNTIADKKHRWGLLPLHYNNLYYEYAEKCIDIITQKLERSEEERQIEFLRQLYSEKFAVLREKAAHKSTALDRDKWRTYSDTFKQIINSNQLGFEEDTIKNIERAFLSKGHRRIAIYGDTEITKVLCKVLGGGTNVSIKYIVEDSKNPVKGFKTVDRNPANYPDCDVMLIADIYAFKDIEAKLKKLQLPFPFYNAAEYIKSLPAGSGDGMQKIKNKIENYERSVDLLNGKLASLAKDKAAYTVKYERTYGELQAIKNSLSFKVGRMIIFIPRKLRNAFKRKK